eukprot:COSAG02_NODE_410_length_22875_cov_43.282755_15_plen_103_part_00
MRYVGSERGVADIALVDRVKLIYVEIAFSERHHHVSGHKPLAWCAVRGNGTTSPRWGDQSEMGATNFRCSDNHSKGVRIWMLRHGKLLTRVTARLIHHMMTS